MPPEGAVHDGTDFPEPELSTGLAEGYIIKHEMSDLRRGKKDSADNSCMAWIQPVDRATNCMFRTKDHKLEVCTRLNLGTKSAPGGRLFITPGELNEVYLQTGRIVLTFTIGGTQSLLHRLLAWGAQGRKVALGVPAYLVPSLAPWQEEAHRFLKIA